MAAAALALAKKIALKIATDLAMDPEKALKFILIIGLCVLIIPLLLFAIPIALVTNIPVILIGSEKDNPNLDIKKQLETVVIYQTAPININQDIQSWIESKKKEFSGYDDIKVEYKFDLNWQMLMAIDAVRYNQNFKKIESKDVISLGTRFVIKDTSTETFTGEETYIDTEYYYVTEKDKKGKPVKVKKERDVVKTRTVTKRRAIITVKTKSLDEILDELKFSNDQSKLALNMYNTIYAADIEGNLNLYDDMDLKELKEYPPGNSNIVYFNQADKRWGYSSYGTSTIKAAGCGPTSLAMVVNSLANRKDVTPKVMADWSVAHGHRCEGAGSYWSLIPEGGKYFGLNVTPVSRKDPKKIVKALSDGYPVIVSMGRGHFTKSGHFIVLRGITSDGKILVNDPASVKRTNQAWDLAIILNESSTNGGVNGSPFWILKPQ